MQKENYTRYMMVGLLLTLALVASLGMAFTSEDARMEKATTAQQKASILRGRQLYVDNCTSCHGTRGEGNVGPALNNITLLKKAPDEVLFAAIVAGRPSTVMPAWGQDNGGPFTNEEIHDIVTFIRAWEPNAPEVQAVAFVPSPARGAAIYASSCFVCRPCRSYGALLIGSSSFYKYVAPTALAGAFGGQSHSRNGRGGLLRQMEPARSK